MRRLNQIRFLRQLTRLGIIERHEIDVAQEIQDVGAPALNPEVHRVARDEFRLLDLAQDIQLQARIDVGEEEIGRRAKLFRNLRAEVREHTEVSLECLRGIEIVSVATTPAKRLPLGALQSAEVDATLLERVELFDGIVGTYHADNAHLREMACRRGEESRRAAEDIVRLSEWRFNGVERDRANYQYGHSCL